MKTFKTYLQESVRTYSFRVRLADCACDGEQMDKIEQALSAFKLVDITKPKSMPVARSEEFYKLGPVGRHTFDVVTAYPANPPQVQQAIHNCCGVPLSHIYVANLMGDQMEALPISTSEEGAVLANSEYPKSDGKEQEHVGLKKVDSLLKELEKNRGVASQYKGVNDEILAKDQAKESAPKTINSLPQNNRSPVTDTGGKATNKKVKAL